MSETAPQIKVLYCILDSRFGGPHRLAQTHSFKEKNKIASNPRAPQVQACSCTLCDDRVKCGALKSDWEGP
jgi:hypothetical protein